MSKPMILETPRLILIASPREWIEQSVKDPGSLAEQADGTLPPDWPSESLRLSAPYILKQMSEDSNQIGWWIWWLLEKAPGDGTTPPLICGNFGFKGPPRRSGWIELSYALVPSAWGRGLATEAVGALIPWALATPAVTRVVATTSPDNFASQRVLMKNGLVQVHDESDERELCFELRGIRR